MNNILKIAIIGLIASLTIMGACASIIVDTALPSCNNHNHYEYQTTAFENYCPNCEKHEGLSINPKGTFESEITCSYCDSDYCSVCGKEKGFTKRYLNEKSLDIISMMWL